MLALAAARICPVVADCADRGDRPERLLAGDGRAVGDAGEDRRLVEEAGRHVVAPPATERDAPTAIAGVGDVGVHLGRHALVVDRAHRGGVEARVTQLDAPGELDEAVDQPVVDVVRRDDPFRGRA